MERGIRNILYVIATVAIVWIVLTILRFLLPYIVIALVVFWVYRLIKNRVNNKKEEEHTSSFKETISQENYKDNYSDVVDVVDVDYEEVDK